MRDHVVLDSRGFWYACKALAMLLLMISATRYGIALAAERLSDDAPPAATVAAAAVAAPEPQVTLQLREVPVPDVAAEAYVVADVSTGRVFASRNADTDLPIASISKLMTALVASDAIPTDSLITISAADRAQTEGTPGRLPSGTTYRAGDLLFPLLMESNNSVGFALARTHSRFVEKMNERAATLGMTATFVEPTGLSAQNRASARDLFTLLRHLHGEHPELLAITRTAAHPIATAKGRRYDVPNFNVFVNDSAFQGGKTGYTDDANQTMAALFSINGRTIAIIVLGTPDRKADIAALREWVTRSLPDR